MCEQFNTSFLSFSVYIYTAPCYSGEKATSVSCHATSGATKPTLSNFSQSLVRGCCALHQRRAVLACSGRRSCYDARTRLKERQCRLHGCHEYHQNALSTTFRCEDFRQVGAGNYFYSCPRGHVAVSEPPRGGDAAPVIQLESVSSMLTSRTRTSYTLNRLQLQRWGGGGEPPQMVSRTET